MYEISITLVLQVVVALGLLNVWLLRSGSATAYRGGDARSLKAEFAAYGLPEPMFYLVGALKIGSAIALLAGIWYPGLILPATATVAFLMVGALVMHAKVGDPPKRSLPAFLMLVMSVGICVLQLA